MKKIKHLKKAVENYLISLDLNNYFETHLNLGLCYCDMDNITLALKHIEIAYEMKNDNLDCLRYYAYVLIKAKKRTDAYKLLLNTSINYYDDCTILEMMILLALDNKDFVIADKMFSKLNSVNSKHDTVRDYKMLRKIAQDNLGDVFRF